MYKYQSIIHHTLIFLNISILLNNNNFFSNKTFLENILKLILTKFLNPKITNS